MAACRKAQSAEPCNSNSWDTAFADEVFALLLKAIFQVLKHSSMSNVACQEKLEVQLAARLFTQDLAIIGHIQSIQSLW